MATGTVHQIEEIGRNIDQYCGARVREQVMAGSEQISASAKPGKVAQWVKGAMARLDDL